MLAIRKMSPGGYEYLTGNIACGDEDLDAGESLSDYYVRSGYPPGQWFGRAAAQLGVAGEVTREQMSALFGEGRHPLADEMQADLIAQGATPEEALTATQLGRRFARYGIHDELRSRVIDAYKAYNVANGRPIGAPIDDDTRAGIRRDVQGQAYADAHEGQRPGEQELRQWLAEHKREMKSATAGYELVIAAPKGVSVGLLADQRTRDLTIELHEQAVRDTLTYFENQVSYTRKGAGGHAQYDVRGIAAAMFTHWDSRAGDPHLHTHITVSTKVQSPDGKWTSLDGRTVHAAAVTLSEYYNSRVRDLFRAHGARWTQRAASGIDLKRPVWDLDGVATELLAGFSQRATAVEQDRAARIVAFRRNHGREPTPKEVLEIGRRAQYGTRSAKTAPRTLEERVQRWRVQAREMVPDTVVSMLGQRIFGGPAEAVATADVADLAARTLAVVSDHYAHFNMWNLLAEAHRQSAHLRVSDRDQFVNQIVETIRNHPDTLTVTAPSLVQYTSAELHRSDGASVFIEHNSQRYTTRETLRKEAALAAWGGRRDGWRISAPAVERALEGKNLNSDQRRAVREFTQAGRRVQLLLAPAGTGKTSAMRAFAQAWRSEGGRVFAFGPSRNAAQILGSALGATPHTLHELTTAIQHGTTTRSERTTSNVWGHHRSNAWGSTVSTVWGQHPQHGPYTNRSAAEGAFDFHRGDVLVIDEIGMAGTHTLHAVIEYALSRGADVRQVGDDSQLGAVEAGGAVRLFEQTNGAVRLHQVVRFSDHAQADASLKLHDGDPSGLDYYFDQRWVQGGSRETMRAAAHRAWRSDLDQGRQSLLIVPTNEDVVALNIEARALRMHRGDVDRDRWVQLHDGTAASAGDWIISRDNNRLLRFMGGKDWVTNGYTWDVLAVHTDGSLKVRHQLNNGTTTLPASYVRTHVDLAYASTIHRVQGISSRGSAHGFVPQGLGRELLYTMMTRAKEDNRVYVETVKHVIDSHQETPPDQDARSVLEATLARSSVEIGATEELRNSMAAAESLRTLVGEYNYIASLGREERIEAVLISHAPDLLDLPAAPALRQTVHNAEDLGWQAEHLLPAVLSQGPLDDADDAAAVVQWRIEQHVLHNEPPARVAEPTAQQISHWQDLTTQAVPAAAVTEHTWQPVWRHAAAGDAEGLNADTAVTNAAEALAHRPIADPMPAPQYVTEVVIAHLNHQRTTQTSTRLPWMAQPEYHTLSPDLIDDLHRVQQAIVDRYTELRTTAVTDPPHWAAALGSRPHDPAAAERWEENVAQAAAYRDTYDIASNDPRRPLGDEPESQGLRARAWHHLIDKWTPDQAGTQRRATAAVNAGDRLHADVDPDELLAALAAADPGTASRHEDPLSVMVNRHQRLSHAILDVAARHALTDYAPQALDQPAERALLAILRQAQQDGWQADRLVRRATQHGRLDNVDDDPASILAWRIHQHIDGREPPARTADVTTEQIQRWQDLTAQAAPHTPVDDEAWQLVWRHAAAGETEGLDADAAVAGASEALATRPRHDPMDDHHYAAEVVVQLLADQRARTEEPALPWLNAPHATVQALAPDLADRLRQLEEAAYSRLDELRAAAADLPPWAAALGPRPDNDAAAEQWEDLLTHAAAYRETYNVRTTNPDTPLGIEPGGNGPKARAWRTITEQWQAAAPSGPEPEQQAHREQLHQLSADDDQQLDEYADQHSGMHY